MAGLTPEEATIKAAIEARLAALRDQRDRAMHQAAALRQQADQLVTAAIRSEGGIAELEAVAGAITPTERPARKPRTRPQRARAGEPGAFRVIGELPPPPVGAPEQEIP